MFIAPGGSGATVIVGRAIQGAAGSTILACGLSLLSAGASGDAQMRSVSLWGAASAAGAAAGPLLGGVLVDITGWQGLFWIDAGIAALCVPLTLRAVPESRDPSRPRSVDLAGTALISAVLVPFVFAVTEGAGWGWLSAPTLGCFAISAVSVVGFVLVEKRVRTRWSSSRCSATRSWSVPASPSWWWPAASTRSCTSAACTSRTPTVWA
ncbi:MFS transporter [Streptomyces sp. NPDC093089]|uniref:MFS transporter n=1 Tax=Streptomyces sp. NPDC093089 TaxID=3366024 RepID=UPI00382DB468